MPPTVVLEGKYELLQLIREGGMGSIYKVRHRLLDEVRVIKSVRPQLVNDAEVKARFLREARVAIKLRHPNIAQLYDFTIDDADGIASIVMEFVDGTTLEELLKTTGPPLLGLAMEIAQQSLRALAYLHLRGFVHRDVSPDNLMLAEDPEGNPQVKLIDLGIAKALSGPDPQLTRTGTFLGKLRYACPEQFGAADAPTADTRGDLYSFGVVLYELLTGIHPIEGDDPSAIIGGHLFRPPRPFEVTDHQRRLAPGLRAAVLKALAKDPDERYANAREFADALAGFSGPRDLGQEEWRQALLRPAPAVAAKSSSAKLHRHQQRLNKQFAPTATPARASRRPSSKESGMVGTAAPTGGLADAVRSIEAALADSDLGLTEVRLYTATAQFGEQPVFSSLHARLELAVQAKRERREGLERATSNVAGKLAAGDLVRAGRLLRAARARYGPDGAFDAIESQRQAMRQKVRDQKLAALLDSARFAAAHQQWQEAGKQVRHAERLAPGDPEAIQLKLQIAALSKRRRAESRREAQLQRKAAQGRKRLGSLLVHARQAWEGGDLRRAIELVGKAGQIDPHHAELQALAVELETAVGNQAAARQRATNLEQVAASVRAHLDREELREASGLLDVAVVRFGPAPALREQWERLEQLKRQQLEWQGEQLLAAAKELAIAGDLVAARDRLGQVRGLGVNRQQAQAVAEEIDAALALRAANQSQIEELLLDAQLLFRVEDFADAARKLIRLLELAPWHTPARALLEQTRQALNRSPSGAAHRNRATAK